MDPPSRAAAPTAIGADLEPKARPTAPSGAGFSYTSTASRHINIPDNKSRQCNKDATRFGIDLTPIQNNREATFLQQEASLTESRRLGQKRNAQKDRLERAPLGLLWPVPLDWLNKLGHHGWQELESAAAKRAGRHQQMTA